MVHEIQVDGKSLPVSFTMRALNHFCIKHKRTIGQSFEMLGATGGEGNPIQLTYEQIADLFYFGLKEGHRKESKKFNLSADDVMDLFDEKPGLLTEVLEIYGESLAKKWAADEEKNSKALKAEKAKSAK